MTTQSERICCDNTYDFNRIRICCDSLDGSDEISLFEQIGTVHLEFNDPD
jgi:hypothetical protein